MLRLPTLLVCLALAGTAAQAQIDLRAGLTQPEDMPTFGKRRGMVMLDVPQVSQGREPWCVPASVAMAQNAWLAMFAVGPTARPCIT